MEEESFTERKEFLKSKYLTWTTHTKNLDIWTGTEYNVVVTLESKKNFTQGSISKDNLISADFNNNDLLDTIASKNEKVGKTA